MLPRPQRQMTPCIVSAGAARRPARCGRRPLGWYLFTDLGLYVGQLDGEFFLACSEIPQDPTYLFRLGHG
ncbi:hypothetical protein [Streptomyces sp. G-5]|uniref:hypothetical protein n=1 Tax=Streptomyces sp. G-5 TaxID=2977231 RepID=UPI0021D13645|nr:hypothetical protein [Streptomyces sp. G-5]MCU4750234.1 hypothetical protein [Streptomyces sp. G-5]